MSQPIRVWDQLQMREGLITPTVPGENFVMSRTGPGGGIALSAGEALELRAYTSLVDPRGSLSSSAAVFRPTVVAAAVQSVAAGVPILGGTTWYVSNVAANGFALGNDSNSGLSKALPKLTLAAAHDAAAPGDTIIINSSETFYDSEFFSINKSLTILPWSYRGVTIRSTNTSYTLYVNADNITLGALVIDTTITAGGRADSAVRGPTAGKRGLKINGALLKGNTYSLYFSGLCALSGVEVQSAGSGRAQLLLTPALAGEVTIDDLTSDANVTCSPSVPGVSLAMCGCTVAYSASGTQRALRAVGCANYLIERNELYVDGSTAASGIQITPHANQTTDRAVIRRNRIRLGAAADQLTTGYGIGIGSEATTAGEFKSVEICENEITHANHGLFVGYCVQEADVWGNVLRDATIGLISKGNLTGRVVHHHNVVIGGPLSGGALRAKESAMTRHYNNLVIFDARSAAAGVFAYGTDGSVGCEFSNNILYAPGLSVYRAASLLDTSTATFRCNDYFCQHGATTFNGAPLADWLAVEPTALTADPVFVGAGDYRLTTASPLIGAGDGSVASLAPRNFVGLPSSPINLGPMPVAV